MEKTLTYYDIIICGGGLSGLSLAYTAFKTGIWKYEKVLILEKNNTDRTWSFWQKSTSPFEEIINHKWTKLVFYNNHGKRTELNHSPYTYNTIKGEDFYSFIHTFLNQLPQVNIVNDVVTKIMTRKGQCTVQAEKEVYTSKFAFSSIYHKPHLHSKQQYFLQHFKGIRIKTSDVNFNPNEALLMDFRTTQENGTTFFYTLPMNKNEVFVEYTLFSKMLLPSEQYDKKINIYLKEVLGIKSFEILETEFGVIPMTDYKFQRHKDNLTYIGTAGGDTRGSTGYTFSNVQKTIAKILETYKKTGSPIGFEETIGEKESLYDATLLRVLDEGKYEGHQLFTDLFENTKASSIFSFLDGESALFNDFKIMKSLKTWPFLKSFIKACSSRLHANK
ncbi:MAG: hypothetical protein EOO92_00100 [Pedobacter sp.]|nr:MAG: hypothetical protein EOO92_00100 [Pedobacter sp.]